MKQKSGHFGESERHVLQAKGIKTKKDKQKKVANNIDCPKCHKDGCLVHTEGKFVSLYCPNCGYRDSQLLEKDVFTCHGKRKWEDLSQEEYAKITSSQEYKQKVKEYLEGPIVPTKKEREDAHKFALNYVLNYSTESHGHRTYKFNELSPSAKKHARKYPRTANTRYGQSGEEVY